MIIYASSPDALASQRFGYDQFYNNANQSDVARLDAARAQSLELALRQQQIDSAARRQDLVDFNQGQDTQTAYDFTAHQNDLNRASRLADVLANKAGNADLQQERILNEAAQQAQWLPNDPIKLARLYPMLTPDRIQRLSVIAGSQGRQIATEQAIKDAPQVQAATEGQQIADAGNRFNRILSSTDPIADNPTNVRHWYNPLSYAGVPAASVVQPSEHAKALMATLQSSLAPKIKAAGGKDSLIQSDAMGNLVPAYQMPVTARPTILPSNVPTTQTAISPAVTNAQNQLPDFGTVPTIVTKQQFDALPSGSIYIGKDGGQYRKP